MDVGFTGTQRGMTTCQRSALRKMLSIMMDKGVQTLHHGDCIGADAQAHEIAVALGYNVVIHPPHDSSKRAFCKSINVREPGHYLDRNHNIVDATQYLIGVPNIDHEVLRSGTWATIRYAIKQRKRVLQILRDGKVREHAPV